MFIRRNNVEVTTKPPILVRCCYKLGDLEMIRKIQHHRKMYVKSFDAGFDKTHIEKHLVTTYWFLFIPIWKTIILLDSNM
jgi:hypothetical protein